MNPRNTVLLVAFAAALFAFIFFYESHISFAPPPPARLLAGFRPATVTNVQVQLRGQDLIRAERGTNGAWRLTRPVSSLAQSLAVEYLLQALSEVVPDTHISAEELKGRRDIDSDYGFENPRATIVLIQRGNDQPLTVKLGNLTAPGDELYAKVVAAEGVEIIATNLLQFVPRQSSDWRDTAFLTLPGVLPDRVTVTNGAKTFALQSDGTNFSWHMLPRDRLDLFRLDRLFRQLQALRVSEFVNDDPKADLELYGLQPPELELDFDQGTNHLVTLEFGRSPTNKPDLVYARRDNQTGVVLVQAAEIAGWRAEKVEFRDRTLAGMYTWAPDEIDISGRTNFTVRRVTNDLWRVEAPFNFLADTNLMRNFLTKLARLSVVPTNGVVAVKDIVPPSEWASYGLAVPTAKFVLKKELPGGTNAVMAEIYFGAASSNGVIYARRPEEPSVYAVALSDFRQLPSSPFELRERTFWHFTEDQVARVVIRQDGKSMEIIRNAPNDWKLAPGSQGIINPLSIEIGAQELGLFAAEKFVSNEAGKKAVYGFGPKSVRITAFVRNSEGVTNEFNLELGAWSTTGNRFGLVESDGQTWIFELSAIESDRLTAYFGIHEEASRTPHANTPANVSTNAAVDGPAPKARVNPSPK